MNPSSTSDTSTTGEPTTARPPEGTHCLTEYVRVGAVLENAHYADVDGDGLAELWEIVVLDRDPDDVTVRLESHRPNGAEVDEGQRTSDRPRRNRSLARRRPIGDCKADCDPTMTCGHAETSVDGLPYPLHPSDRRM